jgi:hypothetical protein
MLLYQVVVVVASLIAPVPQANPGQLRDHRLVLLVGLHLLNKPGTPLLGTGKLFMSLLLQVEKPLWPTIVIFRHLHSPRRGQCQ